MRQPGPLWAAAGTGIQVGAAMVATRYVVDAAGPGSLGFLRYLVGLICLVPALWLRPWRRIAGRDLVPIGLLGIGQFAAQRRALGGGRHEAVATDHQAVVKPGRGKGAVGRLERSFRVKTACSALLISASSS